MSTLDTEMGMEMEMEMVHEICCQSPTFFETLKGLWELWIPAS